MKLKFTNSSRPTTVCIKVAIYSYAAVLVDKATNQIVNIMSPTDNVIPVTRCTIESIIVIGQRYTDRWGDKGRLILAIFSGDFKSQCTDQLFPNRRNGLGQDHLCHQFPSEVCYFCALLPHHYSRFRSYRHRSFLIKS